MNAAMTEQLTPTQSAQLDELGYAVVPGFLDRSFTARLRAHLDSLVPPVGKNPGAVNTLRHPIPGEIVAEALYDTGILALGASLLGSSDLRLLEQVLIRTDPAKGDAPAGPTGWHVDCPFHPDEYAASPRRTYYHHVHALNTVRPGAGAFTVVPGSHHKTYAASVKMTSDEALMALKKDPINVAGIDVTKAIEVCPTDGDLLIFNPMCLHSASRNVTNEPRYVYFASFMDGSASYLKRYLNKQNYRWSAPEALVRRLPAAYPNLLHWN